MQVQKYKLGKAIFKRVTPLSFILLREGILQDVVLLKEVDLQYMGATPLIESEAKLKQIEAKELMSVSDHDAIWILSGYLNTAIEAINALQKGSK